MRRSSRAVFGRYCPARADKKADVMRHIRRGLFFCLMVALPTIVVPTFRSPQSAQAQTQEFDVLIRGGHVIDPRNSINAVMDVAVTGNKIALVASTIAPARARQVVD